MVDFVWQIDQEFPYEPNKNYLFYFRGCCSPPTKGHLNAIQDLLQQRKNVKIVIDQIADPDRHGVPKSVAVSIWKTYIKHCLPSSSTFLKDGSFFNKNYHTYMKGVDVVVFIRGDENKEKAKVMNKFLHNNKKVIKHLVSHKKKIIYFAGKRTKGLSATEFVQSLKSGEASDALRQKYLPPELNFYAAETIIDHLKQCNLK